jgi:limonene 1,2-monooxygenase
MPRFAPTGPSLDHGLRFGIFMPPMHKAGVNPTLAMHRNLQLIEHLDRLGFHEAWIGEHHSAGSELIASPEVFIGAASQRTTHIKLGTGVSSLPYHHPFMLADRIVMLDHLTKGRMMFGAGPGQLTSDAYMLGIEPSTQRPRMEEALDVILRLFAGETVTEKTEWFTCQDAVLQMRPYSDFDIAVAASISPSGSKLAGRYGLGMLSIAATNPMGFQMLAGHWDTWQTEAALNGHVAQRSQWRMMGPMHIAETVEQAKENCRHGLEWVMNYLSHIIPTGPRNATNFDELVDEMNETGSGVIGTPDMAIAQIQRLIDQSGGFGCYLFMGADFADWHQTLRHYELVAEYVMPHFAGQLAPVQTAYDLVMGQGDRFVSATLNAQMEAIGRYEEEKAARLSTS